MEPLHAQPRLYRRGPGRALPHLLRGATTRASGVSEPARWGDSSRHRRIREGTWCRRACPVAGVMGWTSHGLGSTGSPGPVLAQVAVTSLWRVGIPEPPRAPVRRPPWPLPQRPCGLGGLNRGPRLRAEARRCYKDLGGAGTPPSAAQGHTTSVALALVPAFQTADGWGLRQEPGTCRGGHACVCVYRARTQSPVEPRLSRSKVTLQPRAPGGSRGASDRPLEL